jgi:beta-RFAP synthase
VGLGSGSQLSLCLGTALCKFLNLKMSVDEIAQIYNRGQRSGTGISIFKNGGFVVDACKKEQLLPEAMFSSKFPKDWRVIILNDLDLKGTSGHVEKEFFEKNSRASHKKSELSNILLRGIIPSIVYKDFQNFSKNLTEFQSITAGFYSDKQNGMYLSPAISNIMKYIKNYDNIGVGQSSWGPMSYIFVESNLHAKELLSIIQNKFNVYNNVQLNIVSPWNSGFKIVHK